MDWNKRAEEFFGWSKEEVIGKRFADFLVPPQIKENIIDVAKTIIETELVKIPLLCKESEMMIVAGTRRQGER